MSPPFLALTRGMPNHRIDFVAQIPLNPAFLCNYRGLGSRVTGLGISNCADRSVSSSPMKARLHQELAYK